MRSIVSLISAAAFLLHVWLGCCAHHAHAVEGTDHHEHAAVETSHADHDHDHGSEAPQPSFDEHSDCPGKSCGESHCVFLAAGKAEVAKVTFVAMLPIATTAMATGISSASAVTSIDTGGLIALPVRIHLFNQILLI